MGKFFAGVGVSALASAGLYFALLAPGELLRTQEPPPVTRATLPSTRPAMEIPLLSDLCGQERRAPEAYKETAARAARSPASVPQASGSSAVANQKSSILRMTSRKAPISEGFLM